MHKLRTGNPMRFLIILSIFISLEVEAGQCAPEAPRPCSIELENTLPSGKSYRLEIIEASLQVESSGNDEATGYWGAGGAYPSTTIDTISLVVEKSKFSLPPKTYSDLGEIKLAEVKENQYGIVLIVKGGDADDSYYATFVFIDGKVRKRTVRSSLLPDQLWEKTTFRAATD